jgi:succinate dehydrogenase assembly factor 1
MSPESIKGRWSSRARNPSPSTQLANSHHHHTLDWLASSLSIDASKGNYRMRRLSGLQKEVLALYRAILRETVKKDRAAHANEKAPFLSNLLHPGTSTSFARNEFRKEAGQVKRSDFKMIEYKIRKGQKQLKLLHMPGVKVVGGTSS